jgi:hypothetical protein
MLSCCRGGVDIFHCPCGTEVVGGGVGGGGGVEYASLISLCLLR